MREDLLGYLLSALEPHEMRRVDQRLREDPQLREELAEVQRMLDGLDETLATEEVVDVPPELVSRTLAMIPDRHDSSGRGSREATPRKFAVAMRPASEPPPSGRWSWGRWAWPDLLFAALAAVVLMALALPTVTRFRSEARSVACQDNLRQLGLAISHFVLRERDAHLPSLAESGPEAFAGMYAVRLADRGLLSEAQLRWCPDTKMPMAQPALPTGRLPQQHAEVPPVASSRLVFSEELKEAADAGEVERLRWLQRIAGGHYAYSLGVVDGNRYDAPQYEGRSTFAILGDAPIAGNHSADAVDVTKMRWSHRGEGANVLYEDGSVRHLRIPAMLELPDHPFINHRGSIEAGVNIDDASLAPSWRAPFIQARQR